jgi:hypothetical protein
MAQRNRAAPGVDARVVVLQAQQAQHGQALRGKGFVEFDHVHLIQLQAGERQHLLGGRRRADAHDARRHAGHGHADHARLGRQAILGGRGFVGQQQRAGAVVDAAGVAGGHRAVGRTTPLSLASAFQAGLARVLVGVDHHGIALFLRDAHRRDLARQVAGLCAATALSWLASAILSCASRSIL